MADNVELGLIPEWNRGTCRMINSAEIVGRIGSNGPAVEFKVHFISKGKKETIKANRISYFLILFYYKPSKTKS